MTFILTSFEDNAPAFDPSIGKPTYYGTKPVKGCDCVSPWTSQPCDFGCSKATKYRFCILGTGLIDGQYTCHGGNGYYVYTSATTSITLDFDIVVNGNNPPQRCHIVVVFNETTLLDYYATGVSGMNCQIDGTISGGSFRAIPIDNWIAQNWTLTFSEITICNKAIRLGGIADALTINSATLTLPAFNTITDQNNYAGCYQSLAYTNASISFNFMFSEDGGITPYPYWQPTNPVVVTNHSNTGGQGYDMIALEFHFGYGTMTVEVTFVGYGGTNSTLGGSWNDYPQYSGTIFSATIAMPLQEAETIVIKNGNTSCNTFGVVGIGGTCTVEPNF